MTQGDHEALKEATLAGVRWISLARIAGEVLAFVSMIALARLVSPSEFGEFAVAVVVVEIALTITGQGIGTALVQRREVTRKHLEAGLFISILLGIGLGAVAFLTAPLIFTPLFNAGTTTLVQIASPMFVIAAVTAVPQGVAERQLAFKIISLSQILSIVTRAVVAVTLALIGLEAEALMLGWMAGSVAMMLLLLAYARLPWPRPRLAEAREIASFGLPAALSGLSWTGFRNVDFAIVGGRLGLADAGLYWRAYQLAIEYQRKIGATVHQIAFPVYSRTPDLASMLALRRRVVRLVGAVLIPGLLMLAILAPVLVPWLYGSAWRDAVLPTQIMLVGGVATVFSDTMGAVVLAAGRARAWLAYHIACFVVYAVAIYYAAGRGLTTVCVAVAVVQVAITVAAYSGLLRGLVARPLLTLWGDVAPGGAAAVGVAAVAIPLTSALTSANAPAVVTLALVGAAGSASGALALRVTSRETWADLSRITRRALSRRQQARDAAAVTMASQS